MRKRRKKYDYKDCLAIIVMSCVIAFGCLIQDNDNSKEE
nr:MAG TPA: hypothetical protein [Caudoviricetes sp.]